MKKEDIKAQILETEGKKVEDYKNYKPAPQGKAKTAFAKAWQFLKTKALALGLAATMIVAAATLSACGGPENKKPLTPEPPGIENPGPGDDKKEPDDKKEEGEKTNPGGDGGEGDEKEEPGEKEEEPDKPPVVDITDSANLTAEQRQQVINTIVPVITPNLKNTVGDVDKIISLDFQYDTDAQKYKTKALCEYEGFTGETVGLVSVTMKNETTLNTILNSPETIETANKYGEIDIEFAVDKSETRAQSVYEKLVEDGVIEDIGNPDYYGMAVRGGSTSAELNCAVQRVHLYTFNDNKLTYRVVEVKSDSYINQFVDKNLLEGTNGVTYRRLTEDDCNFEYEFSSEKIYDYENGLQVVQNSEAQTANILLGDKVVGTIENGKIHWNKDEEMEF